MKEKGMIITSLLYAILVLFILILFTIILTVGIRKTLIDTVADKIAAEVDYIAPTISGLNVLPVFSGQTFSASDADAGLIATDNVDGDVTSNIACTGSATPFSCTVRDAAGNISATFTRTTTSVTSLTYNYTGAPQLFTAAHGGTYKIELWGAQGGSNDKATGGKGAYITGNIYLQTGQRLFIYVGSCPTSTTGGYNGGASGVGTSNRGGGGATDVRLISGTWSSDTSLRSRLAVAAGGGGAVTYSNGADGGNGGIFTGDPGNQDGSGTYTNAVGGAVTNGGLGGIGTANGANGQFGVGGDATTNGGGGGGGYYGGGGGSYTGTSYGSGAGGSSYVSGYDGFNSIGENGAHTSSIYHYSGLYFTDISILEGGTSMPNHYGSTSTFGNIGSGYARITFVSE